MITEGEFYYYRWDELIAKELERVVAIARQYHGSDESALEALDCAKDELEAILAPARGVRNIPGPPLVEITLMDVLTMRTLDCLLTHLGKSLIDAAQRFGWSIRDTARFLDFPEWEIRRLMARVSE